jgi:hypothetical protein
MSGSNRKQAELLLAKQLSGTCVAYVFFKQKYSPAGLGVLSAAFRRDQKDRTKKKKKKKKKVVLQQSMASQWVWLLTGDFGPIRQIQL